MFRSVLVANRGEIAVRIISTLRRMGIEPVLLASLPDRRSLAAQLAGRVVVIEGYSAAETYLDIGAVLAAARDAGCEAIHPGYGFLSERADFAEACAAAGITFIGPPAAVLRALGDKGAARRLAISQGVPVVPGWDGADDDGTLAAQASRLGFPVMIKARGGGGGRGMREVREPGAMLEALAAARREAAAAFGDPGLLIEQLVTNAHHVEVQVVADAHGNSIHLGERDCSVQRRHQKVIEETPSPAVDAALRSELTAAALRLAHAVGYVNAGTFEFLIGPPGPSGGTRPFYFLEVNPRLQVEHPVTEMVTGLDLVELQLRVAAGEPLPIGQDEVTFSGHAIECRVNAENPWSDFKPGHGRISGWAAPPPGPGLRVDAGYGAGYEVPAAYDSLVAKVIVRGANRALAIEELQRALRSLHIEGIPTNTGLHLAVLGAETFTRGEATVSWLEGALPSMPLPRPLLHQVAAAAAATMLGPREPGGGARSPWQRPAEAVFWLDDGFGAQEVRASFVRPAGVRVEASGQSIILREGGIAAAGTADRVFRTENQPAFLLVRPFGRGRWEVCEDAAPGGAVVARFSLVPPPPLPHRSHSAAEGSTEIVAPLAGTVAAVRVSAGDVVEAGQLLVLLDAMKMEHRVTAPIAGTVRDVAVRERAVVLEGDLLLEME